MTDATSSPPSAALPAPLNVSFLGLGVMGGAMARHLGEAGHRLTIYNRTPARAEAWQTAHPGLAVRAAASPAEAPRGPMWSSLVSATTTIWPMSS
jgi:3-hydroxyisobutyrate dehydrogenase